MFDEIGDWVRRAKPNMHYDQLWGWKMEIYLELEKLRWILERTHIHLQDPLFEVDIKRPYPTYKNMFVNTDKFESLEFYYIGQKK